MIADVIRNASTEHEIYFLLTAYVEAARFCDKLHCLSEHITRLPLNGVTDISNRFEKLMIELDVASKRLDDNACVVIREAVHIFSSALNRLQLIDEQRFQPMSIVHSPPGAEARAA
jgi:hypothetical protein